MQRYHLIILCIVFVAMLCGGRSSLAEDPWKVVGPFMKPPAHYVEQRAPLESVLQTPSGEEITHMADWQKRRSELLQEWHALLGNWPELITDPEIEILEQSQQEGYRKQHIRFRWTPQQWTDGYLLIPSGNGPFPAVLTVYYEPETAIGQGAEFRDYAIQLTQRGFVTLSIGTREASQAQQYALYYPELNRASVQPLSMLAYAAANSWYVLSSLDEVDADRIGIAGHSFGGKWAMFASCLFDKFACAVWSDPGIMFDDTRPSINYWEPWYLGYHPQPWRKRGMITAENPALGLYPQLRAQQRDLHELHALMAPRPFLVSGGSEDPPERWAALNLTRDVYRLYGLENSVGMHNRPEHTPNRKANDVVYAFFKHYLNP